jgi:hypothetical protein
MTELTILKVIAASCGEAETLSGVVPTDQSRKVAPLRSVRITDDDRSVLTVVMAEYISDGLGASIVGQQQPRAWNLPASVAMLSPDQQMLEVPVELHVLNRHWRQAVADPNHRLIRACDFAHLQIGHLSVSRKAGLPIESTEAQSWLAEQSSAVTKDPSWRCQAAQLKNG